MCIFEQIHVGGDRNFGYLIADPKTKEAALVDPSYSPEVLVERVKAQSLKVKWIINTHGHGDHTNGNAEAQELTGAKVVTYEGSAVPYDIGVKEGDSFSLGNLTLKFHHVPGHCADHLVVAVAPYDLLLTGDHLFVGKIGGTMDEESAKEQHHHLWRLYELFPETATVWPGHDVGCRPSSTLALEKVANPFLVNKDLEAFLQMKRDWGNYKKVNGLI